jgi:membrane-bound lytic murein transglycosylase B
VRLFNTLSAFLVFAIVGAAESGGAQPVVDPVRPLFAEWVQQLRAEAEASGISAATLDSALNGLEPLPVVIERDRTQRELTVSVRDYVKERVTRGVIRRAREAVRKHATLLRRVERHYGVPPDTVVAIWALESSFGRFSGVRPTIQALSTLAWEGRRGQLFRTELLTALGILDRGEVAIDRLKGSWAGAMGQPQFLPSSYLKYAQDFDGDGQKDIWSSLPDVFASIANYLRESGWKPRQPWGVPVALPKRSSSALDAMTAPRLSGCGAERDLTDPARVREWVRARVALRRSLARAASASLLKLGRSAFLVTSNYEAVLAYNCAHSYAMSVVELSDAVRTRSAGGASRAKRPTR